MLHTDPSGRCIGNSCPTSTPGPLTGVAVPAPPVSTPNSGPLTGVATPITQRDFFSFLEQLFTNPGSIDPTSSSYYPLFLAIDASIYFIPYVGFARGCIEALIGRSITTGDELEWWARVLGVLPIGSKVGNYLARSFKEWRAVRSLDLFNPKVAHVDDVADTLLSGAIELDLIVLGNHPKDIALRQSLNRLQADPGFYRVVGHGKAYEMRLYSVAGQTITANSLDAKALAAMLTDRGSDYTKGSNIQLFSCWTGLQANGFAAQLAKELNVTVRAPNMRVLVFPSLSNYTQVGYYVDDIDKIDDFLQGPYANLTPEWRDFYPDGTSSVVQP